MNEYVNQLEIFNPDDWTYDVHIIGMGGISANLFWQLLCLGVPVIHIWDDDRVENTNLPSQSIYRKKDIGRYKVDAARLFARRQQKDTKVFVHRRRFSAKTQVSGVVFSGVDSMSSRMAIWEALRVQPLVVLYLDGRTASEEIHLHALDPTDIDQGNIYEQWLYPDDESSPLPCGGRSVIHPNVTLAARMVAYLTLFNRGKALPQFFALKMAELQ